jgi:hypothetical protein
MKPLLRLHVKLKRTDLKTPKGITDRNKMSTCSGEILPSQIYLLELVIQFTVISFIFS